MMQANYADDTVAAVAAELQQASLFYPSIKPLLSRY
jgi:hypothetical protein